jgi:hypothetical protein
MSLWSLLHQVPLLAFLFVAVVRRMASERAALFSKPVAVAFHAVICLILLGDVWNGPTVVHAPLLALIYGAVFSGVLLSTAVTPAAGEFANGVRRANKLGQARAPFWSDLAANWAPLAGFCAVTVVSGLIATHAPGINDPDIRRRWLGDGSDITPGSATGARALLPILVGICVLVYFGSARQYFNLRFRKNAGTFFVLCVFCLWVMPLLVAAIAGVSARSGDLGAAISAISPFAGLALAADWGGAGFATAGAASAVACSALLCVLFLSLRLGAEASALRAALQSRAPTRREAMVE